MNTRWAFHSLALLAGLLCVGCGQSEVPSAYVARVGNAFLSAEELNLALQDLPSLHDSSSARQQMIDQWITQELLYQEARNQNLINDPEVRRQLEASQRAVLVDAYVLNLYEEDIDPPTEADLQAYYDRNRDRLRLREPFVQVRYLASAHPDSATEARSLLQDATSRGTADSVWNALVMHFASDPDGSRTLSTSYFPERHLLTDQPQVHQALQRLENNQIAPIIEADSMYHLLQLVARVPTGSVPERAWIEDEIRRQLLIDTRKQLYARHVQRLRTEAQARNALEVR